MSEKKVVINKRLKCLSRDELLKLTKEVLIDKIIQLESYNLQLRNLLKKKLSNEEKSNDEYAIIFHEKDVSEDIKEVEGACLKEKKVNTKEKKRTFNFSMAHKRHVLLRFLYFGWDYQGYACQEDSNDTIEYHMFKALTRTCLIQSRETSNYHRCGRTDKKVSAFYQVISIDLRSKFPESEQLSEEALAGEINYCGLLNRVLPSNIQCVAWMPLSNPNYSARFDCIARTYRYYFPKGALNIEAMREACLLLQKHADFRNFCKMDVHNGVTNYMRDLRNAKIVICPDPTDAKIGYTMYYLEIKANAFLWHQIRCIMAILFLIGEGNEEPNVINELLDVTSNPCKPQYTPAMGLPLNLFHCEFRTRTSSKSKESNVDIHEPAFCEEFIDSSEEKEQKCDIGAWIYDEETLQKLIESIQSEWTHFSIRSSMVRNVLHNLENLMNSQFKHSTEVSAQVFPLQEAVKSKQYQKLLSRKRCESLENRIEHFVKKQRLTFKNELKNVDT